MSVQLSPINKFSSTTACCIGKINFIRKIMHHVACDDRRSPLDFLEIKKYWQIHKYGLSSHEVAEFIMN